LELLKELAMDVSYALHSLELEDNERKQKKKRGRVKINTAASLRMFRMCTMRH